MVPLYEVRPVVWCRTDRQPAMTGSGRVCVHLFICVHFSSSKDDKYIFVVIIFGSRQLHTQKSPYIYQLHSVSWYLSPAQLVWHWPPTPLLSSNTTSSDTSSYTSYTSSYRSPYTTSSYASTLFLRLLSQHFLFLHLPTPLSSMQSVVLGAWLLNNCDLPRCKPLVIRPLLFTVIWYITYDVGLSLRSGYIVVRE